MPSSDADPDEQRTLTAPAIPGTWAPSLGDRIVPGGAQVSRVMQARVWTIALAIVPQRWTIRLFVGCGLVAVLAVAAVAVPLLDWMSQRVATADELRACSLAAWMAADAQRGPTHGSAALVAREPGVVSAVVLAVNGRVLMPASRATESYVTIPAIGVPVSQVIARRFMREGRDLHLVQPIVGADGTRQAIAWLVLRQSPDLRAPLPLVALTGVLALLFSTVIARSLQATTEAGLSQLCDELHQAAFGGGGAVHNPLPGTDAGAALALSLDRFIARVRQARGGDARQEIASGQQNRPGGRNGSVKEGRYDTEIYG